MRDRIPVDPGRVKMTRSDGTFEYVTIERADNPTQEGTPLNKALLDYAVAACGVTAGTATALTLDDAFGGFTLVDGAKANFRLHVASGANPTLNVNGTGAKALVDVFANPMPSGIAAGMWVEARYSNINDSFVVTGISVTPTQISKWNRSVRVLIDDTVSDSASAVQIPIDNNCTYIEVSMAGISPLREFLSVYPSNTNSYYSWLHQANISISADGNVTNELFSGNNHDYILYDAKCPSESAMTIHIHLVGATMYFKAELVGTDENYMYRSQSNGGMSLTSANSRMLNISGYGGFSGARLLVKEVIL